jgi:hypothetical protein
MVRWSLIYDASMARTAQADYRRSLKITTLPLPDPDAATRAARHVLEAEDAAGRAAAGQRLLDLLSAQTGIPTPELVVPDDRQPHRRRGGRIVYSLQGDYRRRRPSPGDPSVARGGKPLGRIRVPHRTPARGDIVRPSAFLHTLLHEFCHHHDAEAIGLFRSFHTAGFYARLRDLRAQVEPPLAPAPRIPERRRKPRARRRQPPVRVGLIATIAAFFRKT